MTDIYDLLGYEEGWREKPYIDSEGYPTVGFGFLIGPKGAPLSDYTFTLPRTAGEVWMRCKLDEICVQADKYVQLNRALQALAARAIGSLYNDPRCAVLLSMCYQMGVVGVSKFTNTLDFMAAGDYTKAAVNMLASKWATQTPNRAKRHAKQMQTGLWASEYGQ